MIFYRIIMENDICLVAETPHGHRDFNYTSLSHGKEIFIKLNKEIFRINYFMMPEIKNDIFQFDKLIDRLFKLIPFS